MVSHFSKDIVYIMKVKNKIWMDYMIDSGFDPENLTPSKIHLFLQKFRDKDIICQIESEIPEPNIIVLFPQLTKIAKENKFVNLFLFLKQYFNNIYIDDILYWYFASGMLNTINNVIVRLRSISYIYNTHINPAYSRKTQEMKLSGYKRHQLLISLFDTDLNIKLLDYNDYNDRSPYHFNGLISDRSNKEYNYSDNTVFKIEFLNPINLSEPINRMFQISKQESEFTSMVLMNQYIPFIIPPFNKTVRCCLESALKPIDSEKIYDLDNLTNNLYFYDGRPAHWDQIKRVSLATIATTDFMVVLNINDYSYMFRSYNDSRKQYRFVDKLLEHTISFF